MSLCSRLDLPLASVGAAPLCRGLRYGKGAATVTPTDLELYDRPDEPSEAMLVHPLTSEVVDLINAPDRELAAFLKGLRDDTSNMNNAKRIVTQEILRRMDGDAAWTRHAGPYKLVSSSPEPVEEFDAASLRGALLELVDEKELTIEAVDRAIEQVITYKAHKSGIKALRKLGGRAKEIIDSHSFSHAKDRYVVVQRIGQM